MSGIDYSKWDHFGEDDSSSESEEEESPKPRVTKLDTPCQISTTRDGTIHVSQQQQEPTAEKQSKVKASAKNNETLEDAIKEWTARGGTVKLKNDTYTLYWSQDRETVTLRMKIPLDTKASSVQVLLKGAVSVEDRHAATLTNTKPTLQITVNHTTLLEGQLPYPVYLQDNVMDWTLETFHNQKYLVVSLNKATPMPGMTINWTRPMMHFDEIKLPESSKISSFQQAWNEAHEQFREKMQQKQKKQNVSSNSDTLVDERRQWIQD